MMIQSNYGLKNELGFIRALIVSTLREQAEELTASKLLVILHDHFQTLSSINYHLDWLARNTDYVQKNSRSVGKTQRHTYQYKGEENNGIK